MNNDRNNVVPTLVNQDHRVRPLLPIVLSTTIAGLVSCAIGAGLAWLYFSQQVHSSVTPRPSDGTTLPATTPKPTPAKIPVRSAIPEPSLTPIGVPNSGEVRTYASMERVAPLQIHTSPGSNYLVKLEDASSRRMVLI